MWPLSVKKYLHKLRMGKMVFQLFSKLFSYLRTIKSILMTLSAGFQVSDHCPLGYLFLFIWNVIWVCLFLRH